VIQRAAKDHGRGILADCAAWHGGLRGRTVAKAIGVGLTRAPTAAE